MKNILTSITVVAVVPFSLHGAQHSIAPTVNYHLDQKSAPGYGLRYQFQRNESFNFELSLLQSNDIELDIDANNLVGSYDQFQFGANFIKPIDTDLSLIFGLGTSYTFSSDNEEMLEEQSIAPYLKMALGYQVTKSVSIDFGQFSHFAGDELSTNHSVYLALNWQFYQDNKAKPSKKVAKKSPIVIPKVVMPVVITSQPSQTITNTSTEATTPTIAAANDINETSRLQNDAINNTWYLQFGAFNSKRNAENFINQLKLTHPNSQLISTLAIISSNGLFKVVNQQGKENKQLADELKNIVQQELAIATFITQIKY